MTLGTLIALALAVVAALVLHRMASPRRRKKSVGDLRVELRRMVRDPEVAERLLARHRRAQPEATEAEVLRSAIAELRADRRR